MASHLSLRDAGLGLLVVFIWGTNFVVVRWGLGTLPPLLMAAIRFALVLFPAIFFLKKPDIAWSNLLFYGLCLGTGQFGLLYIAMDGYISPGMASVVMQMQVFFTIALAMWRTGEKIKPHQMAAFALAIAGMGVIALHNGQGTTIAGVVLVLLAALGWALGNQASREAGQKQIELNMLAYVVWAAIFSVPPLLILSLLTEGPTAIVQGIHHATLTTWAAVLWQSVGNTMFGYACWAWLLSRYPAATVAPLSLLVPIFGFAASATLLGEPLPAWKIGATLLIMAGLAVNLLWRPRKAILQGEAS